MTAATGVECSFSWSQTYLSLASTWKCFSKIDSLGVLQITINFLDRTDLFSCCNRTAFLTRYTNEIKSKDDEWKADLMTKIDE